MRKNEKEKQFFINNKKNLKNIKECIVSLHSLVTIHSLNNKFS